MCQENTNWWWVPDSSGLHNGKDWFPRALCSVLGNRLPMHEETLHGKTATSLRFGIGVTSFQLDSHFSKQWIGLRSFMINSVTNLQVGGGDITPSACEEAMCEATEITGYEGFVPCSGASRRRMNVTSTIARPVDQQCRQVNVTPWEDFFGPSTGYGDWPEGWGE